MATISGFGSLIFTAPLQYNHDVGELISFVRAGSATTPYAIKQAAEASLQAALPTGAQRADHLLREAITRIQKSLAARLWTSESTLARPQGYRVFNWERRAIRFLGQPPLAGQAVASDAISSSSGPIDSWPKRPSLRVIVYATSPGRRNM